MNTHFILKPYWILLGLLLILSWSAIAEEQDHDHDDAHVDGGGAAYYLAEHGDLDVGYEDGELELNIHLHAGAIVDGNALAEENEFSPDQMIVVATDESEILRPAGELWEPTGAEVNEPMWVLPQNEKEGLPAFGFATEEIPVGVFVNDMIQLNLRYIHGPGDFSLWEDDAFGLPIFALSTHEAMTSTLFPVGLHAHYNWGFTAPGDYTLVFEVVAELVEGGRVDALSVYHFKVTEQPLCLNPLPADVNGDCVVDEHDLEIVEENLGKTSPTWPGDYDHDHEDDHEHEEDHD